MQLSMQVSKNILNSVASFFINEFKESKEETKTYQKCKVCKRKVLHMRHHLLTHEDILYPCSTCGSVYQSLRGLNMHKNIKHTHHLSYYCETCDRGFHNASNLATHKKRHLEIDSFPFKCHYAWGKSCYYIPFITKPCFSRFEQTHQLQNHMKYRHGNVDDSRYKPEDQVADSFKEANLLFSRDHQNTICFNDCKELNSDKKARIDFHLYEFQLHGVNLFVEVDENCHDENKQSEEGERMITISQALRLNEDIGHLPIVWIRFNPSIYYTDGVFKNEPLQERITALLGVIDLFKVIQLSKPVNLVYMYYHTEKGLPIIDQRLKNLLLPEFHARVVDRSKQETDEAKNITNLLLKKSQEGEEEEDEEEDEE
jgi:Zinc-finger double-stranded RNA-binding